MAESFSFISVYFRSSKGKGIVNGGGAQSEGGKTPDMPRGETRGGEYKKAQWHTTVYTLHSQACAVAPRQSDGIGGRKRRGGNPSSCLGAHLLRACNACSSFPLVFVCLPRAHSRSEKCAIQLAVLRQNKLSRRKFRFPTSTVRYSRWEKMFSREASRLIKAASFLSSCVPVVCVRSTGACQYPH